MDNRVREDRACWNRWRKSTVLITEGAAICMLLCRWKKSGGSCENFVQWMYETRSSKFCLLYIWYDSCPFGHRHDTHTFGHCEAHSGSLLKLHHKRVIKCGHILASGRQKNILVEHMNFPYLFDQWLELWIKNASNKWLFFEQQQGHHRLSRTAPEMQIVYH